jgi:hypothetical protein
MPDTLSNSTVERAKIEVAACTRLLNNENILGYSGKRSLSNLLTQAEVTLHLMSCSLSIWMATSSTVRRKDGRLTRWKFILKFYGPAAM